MGNGLGIAPPPRRPTVVAKPDAAKAVTPKAKPVAPPAEVAISMLEPSASPKEQGRAATSPDKFDQVKEDERVQFNKRITRRAADGFEILSIRLRKKLPELLEEALDLLEERYGKVG